MAETNEEVLRQVLGQGGCGGGALVMAMADLEDIAVDVVMCVVEVGWADLGVI